MESTEQLSTEEFENRIKWHVERKREEDSAPILAQIIGSRMLAEDRKRINMNGGIRIDPKIESDLL